jgi:ribosome-binding ATPase
MKLGIIGLPQSGKKTVFEALTKTQVPEGQKREKRIGTVAVPDQRVDVLSEMYRPRKTTFAQVEYLLPASSESDPAKKDAGSWTQVRDAEALVHVVRNFPVPGLEEPEPFKDVRSLFQELILADLVTVEKRVERIEWEKKRGKGSDQQEHALLLECRETLEQELPLWKKNHLAAHQLLKGFAFLSAKPTLVLFNNEEGCEQAPSVDGLIPPEQCMVIRGKLEGELAHLTDEEAQDFLSAYHITQSAMHRVIRSSYELLGLISFFTVGEDEVRAWTIRRETSAADAAGVIHSDIKKGFIRAEVLSYQDLMAAGSYAEARKKGMVRLEGKTYSVADGDIINFRFNV